MHQRNRNFEPPLSISEDFSRRIDGGKSRMLSLNRTRRLDRANQHASAKDFCSVFHQDMNILYWVALTLTSDEHMAEQCFVAGLDECIEGNSVFKEWARSWSRRVVIKNAIRLTSPRPGMPAASPGASVQDKPVSSSEVVPIALAQLPLFDRFVFVMSVLEGYADRDCATLLGCSSTDVAEARLRALRQVQRAIELGPAPADEHVNQLREAVVLYGADVA
jgi:DNA-directed RNA polymerase specialized sigma24 family protein